MSTPAQQTAETLKDITLTFAHSPPSPKKRSIKSYINRLTLPAEKAEELKKDVVAAKYEAKKA